MSGAIGPVNNAGKLLHKRSPVLARARPGNVRELAAEVPKAHCVGRSLASLGTRRGTESENAHRHTRHGAEISLRRGRPLPRALHHDKRADLFTSRLEEGASSAARAGRSTSTRRGAGPYRTFEAINAQEQLLDSHFHLVKLAREEAAHVLRHANTRSTRCQHGRFQGTVKHVWVLLRAAFRCLPHCCSASWSRACSIPALSPPFF